LDCPITCTTPLFRQGLAVKQRRATKQKCPLPFFFLFLQPPSLKASGFPGLGGWGLGGPGPGMCPRKKGEPWKESAGFFPAKKRWGKTPCFEKRSPPFLSGFFPHLKMTLPVPARKPGKALAAICGGGVAGPVQSGTPFLGFTTGGKKILTFAPGFLVRAPETPPPHLAHGHPPPQLIQKFFSLTIVPPPPPPPYEPRLGLCPKGSRGCFLT